jgi:hypothetical protein
MSEKENVSGKEIEHEGEIYWVEYWSCPICQTQIPLQEWVKIINHLTMHIQQLVENK